MNFSYRIRSLWYLTCCKIFLSAAIISINHIRSTSALKIEQDQQEIERSLHDFMTKRRDKTVSMKNAIKWTKVNVLKRSICNLSPVKKINLCYNALIDSEDFEYEFETYNCEKESFSYTNSHFDDVESDNKISMYRCPDLKPPDLRQMFVSRISSGIRQAMLYIREHSNGILRPARHLTEITENDLGSPFTSLEEAKSKDRPWLMTPVGSTLSPAVSTRRSITAPNSPALFIPTPSPQRLSAVRQSRSLNFLEGLLPSIPFRPINSNSPNAARATSQQRTNLAAPTPTKRLKHRRTHSSEAGTSNPIQSQGSGQYSAESLTPFHRRRNPSSGAVRKTTNPIGSSSAAASGDAITNRGRAAEDTPEKRRSNINRSDDIRTDSDARTGKQRVTRQIGPSRLSATSTSTVQDQKITGSSRSSREKKTRGKSLDSNWSYPSESKPLLDDESEFPGFQTSFSQRTPATDSLGDRSSADNSIQIAQSYDDSGIEDDSDTIPLFPSSDTKNSKRDRSTKKTSRSKDTSDT